MPFDFAKHESPIPSPEQSLADQISSILDEGDVPLILVANSVIRVKGYSFRNGLEPTKFVAFSHVRSQEKPFSHHTSTDTLQPLQSLATDVFLDSGIVGSYQAIPWWIDSLCIPRDDRRRLAKARIKDIFAAATAVIVIDVTLCEYQPQSPADYMAAVRQSPWIHRLWTIQEAAVAKQLYFKFKELQSLDRIMSQQEKAMVGGKEASELGRDEHSSPREQLKLLQCLDILSHDIKIKDGRSYDELGLREDCQNSLGDQQIMEDYTPRQLRKSRLKAVLRLGYLSTFRFRFICTPYEYAQAQATGKKILQLYDGGQVDNHKEEHESGLNARLEDLEHFYVSCIQAKSPNI